MTHPGSSIIGARTVLMGSGGTEKQEQSDGQYVVLVDGNKGENSGQQNIMLTPEQLQQLGIGAEDGENVV